MNAFDDLLSNKLELIRLLRKVDVQSLLDELNTRDVYGDVRIRQVSRDGQFRVVAPDARRNADRVYVNNVLVIEQSTKDSLGNSSWAPVGSRLLAGMAYSRSNPPDPREAAIFWLLANSNK